MKNLLRSAVVVSVLAAGTVQAATLTVTSVGNSFAFNQWYKTNVRDVNTGYPAVVFAEITGNNPNNGTGSVEMSITPSPLPAAQDKGKVDYAYTWGYVPGRTLGNVDVVGFDWFRAESTVAPHFAPALRLLYDADGRADTTNDIGYLIWEQIYNGSTAQNQWVVSDLENQFFWQRKLSTATTVEDFDMTLANWAAGVAPAVPAGQPYDLLGSSTAILGIEFGIGSGWSGSFRGFVDNVRIGFDGQEATTFNFELEQAEVPEPASLALIGLGALGFAARRRKQN